MTLVMTLLVRDEADILRQNIAFHLAAGVDHVIAMDNGSEDGTVEILEDYARAGVLDLIHQPSRDFQQATWVTEMALRAREARGADWILSNDADEFWLAPEGGLKAVLARTQADVLICQRYNMVAPWPRIGTAPWHEVLRWRARRPTPPRIPKDIYNGPLVDPFFCSALPPKALTRARGLTRVAAGQHNADYAHDAVREESAIRVYHFPCRDMEKFARNTWNKGEASERVPRQIKNENWKSRRWYRMMRDGGPERIYAEAMPGTARFLRDRLTLRLVRDDTMYRLLSAQERGAGS